MAEPRSVILSELIAEDPQYRDYLKRVVQKALNHQLTQAFLMERYEHYLTAATELQVRRLEFARRSPARNLASAAFELEERRARVERDRLIGRRVAELEVVGRRGA